MTIIAHSGGAIYATVFAKKYPELIQKLILLDPLSLSDSKFKTQLTPYEYKRSGVDKLKYYKTMLLFAQLKLGFINKLIMKNAPPFCYYKFKKHEKEYILNSYAKVHNLKYIITEYRETHNEQNLKDIKDHYPSINIILITHSSSLAIDANIKYGRNTKEFATKIENLWQTYMKEYLEFSSHSTYIQATNSTHYIHLTDMKLVINTINQS